VVLDDVFIHGENSSTVKKLVAGKLGGIPPIA
jgi:hypothetical protein